MADEDRSRWILGGSSWSSPAPATAPGCEYAAHSEAGKAVHAVGAQRGGGRRQVMWSQFKEAGPPLWSLKAI